MRNALIRWLNKALELGVEYLREPVPSYFREWYFDNLLQLRMAGFKRPLTYDTDEQKDILSIIIDSENAIWIVNYLFSNSGLTVDPAWIFRLIKDFAKLLANVQVCDIHRYKLSLRSVQVFADVFSLSFWSGWSIHGHEGCLRNTRLQCYIESRPRLTMMPGVACIGYPWKFTRRRRSQHGSCRRHERMHAAPYIR
jgi:hypothetical protein